MICNSNIETERIAMKQTYILISKHSNWTFYLKEQRDEQYSKTLIFRVSNLSIQIGLTGSAALIPPHFGPE